jgi:hypothetical protein
MTSSHLEFNVVQINTQRCPLDAPQDKIGLFGLFDAGMGEWNMGKGM